MVQFTWETDLDPIAVFAAVLALASLSWQIVAHLRQGPRIRLSVMADAEFVGGPDDVGTGFLFLTARNVGTASTTVTHMVLYWYSNRLMRFLDCRWIPFARRLLNARGSKGHKAMWVKDPSYGSLISSGIVPTELVAGRQWQGGMKYDEELLRLRNNGLLFVGIAHSMSEQDSLIRIPPKGENAAADC